MESLFLIVAVAGATEFVKRLFDRDYRAAVIIAVSAVIGGLAGLFGIDGLTVANGIMLGVAASGCVTIAAKVNTRTAS
ncbi:hypothetical protein [Rhodococcus aetherivorans]|uniref:hypothetical protein n=1 Tax=Rhodococcus aetherivorans TaxID=191292 RepID=UPI002949C460|nr:hypothetical protein [Rhodococcus aetherivorans]MDV6295172.1 hypothetical protein [Rhodococcus aetherivorans]